MKQPTLLIAGESFDDLLNTLRRMPVTGTAGRHVQITFNPGDPEYVNWARAVERYAADLLTVECDLTHEERLELTAQRVATRSNTSCDNKHVGDDPRLTHITY